MKNKTSPFKKFLHLSFTIPLGGAIGLKQFKNNNDFIKGLWGSLNNPKCPYCFNGVLSTPESFPADKKAQDDNLTIYACNKCAFVISAKPSELRGLIHQQQMIRNTEFVHHNQIVQKLIAA
jgi:hypothetical protein